MIGLVKDIGRSEVDAWLEVGRLGLNIIKVDQPVVHEPTFGELAEHFRLHELKKKSGIALKASETVDVAELNLDGWVLP